MRVCSKSSFVFIWFLFSLSIFLSILPSLLMSTPSFLQVSPVASHTNQPYPHYTDFDSVETSDRLPQIFAPIQPPQTNPPTTTSTNTRAKPPPQISTQRLPASTTLTLTPSHRRCRSLGFRQQFDRPRTHRPRHTLTGRVPIVQPTTPQFHRPCLTLISTRTALRSHDAASANSAPSRPNDVDVVDAIDVDAVCRTRLLAGRLDAPA